MPYAGLPNASGDALSLMVLLFFNVEFDVFEGDIADAGDEEIAGPESGEA